MQHRTLKSALGLALMAACTAPAFAGVNVGATLTSDYVFRGTSQSNENFAFQPSITYEHESGFFASAWGSNVTFLLDKGGPQLAEDDGVEVDLTLGFDYEVNDKFSVMAWVVQYMYPSSDRAIKDYTEYHLSGTMGWFTVGFDFSNEFFGSEDTGTYLSAGLDIPLENDFGIIAGVGRQTWDQFQTASSSNDVSYTDYRLGVKKSWNGFDFALTYFDTNGSEVAPSFAAIPALADQRFVFSVSRSFSLTDE
jgi:uncharacterized protein (TIGR02001 family)